MTIRQLVTFAIYMENNDGIVGKSPGYISEKFRWCSGKNCPEVQLDNFNHAKFKTYAKTWGFNWNTEKDYWDVPIDQFDPITGEAKKEGKNG